MHGEIRPKSRGKSDARADQRRTNRKKRAGHTAARRKAGLRSRCSSCAFQGSRLVCRSESDDNKTARVKNRPLSFLGQDSLMLGKHQEKFPGARQKKGGRRKNAQETRGGGKGGTCSPVISSPNRRSETVIVSDHQQRPCSLHTFRSAPR